MPTRASRGRPRRTPMTATRRKGPAKSITRTRDEVVGRIIDVSWPSDDTYYSALVLSYDERKHQHKVIYIDEESIEVMELGSGPGLRAWRPIPPSDDPLIGAELLLDDKDAAGENWFDFMRVEGQQSSAPFIIIVYALITNPDPEEVTGPRDLAAPNQRFYRVIHQPNDYLTTLDLSSVDYTVVSQAKADVGEEPDEVQNVDEENGQPEDDAAATGDEEEIVKDEAKTKDDPKKKKVKQDPEPPVDLDLTTAVDDDDDMPLRPTRTTRPRPTSKPVATAPVDDDPTREDTDDAETPIRPVGRKTRNVKLVDDDEDDDGNDDGDTRMPADENDGDYKPDSAPVEADDDDDAVVDVDDDDRILPVRSSKRNKPPETGQRVTRGRAARRPASQVRVDVDDGAGSSLDEDQTSGMVRQSGARKDVDVDMDVDGNEGEKKVKTEKPEPSNLYPENFEDEKQHDTASDEEKLGWTKPSQAPLRATKDLPQIGDFISLDAGSGGDRRKAFVEAYLPETGTHFVAFCDERGGHVQIKLTEDNHTLVSDAEVEKMTNDQAEAPAIDEDEPEIAEVVEKRVTRARGRPKRELEGVEKSSAAKKKASRRRYSTPKILGKSSGDEIVSRCVSVVWPGTKLVYVALVMGYSAESRQHILLYMVDHCVETLDLRYREWELLPRGKEPWNSTGMVGKRIFVWWPGEYSEKETQDLASELFGDEPKVAYEAYVLSYTGKGVYKIIYPCNEDCEERELNGDNMNGLEVTEKDWDLLEEGKHEVAGLPVMGWEG